MNDLSDRQRLDRDHIFDDLVQKNDELLDALQEMVAQHCESTEAQCTLDSCAISSNADAMRILAKYGRLKIEREFGRRVIGRLMGRDQK